MKVIDPGHMYALDELDADYVRKPVYLEFVKRMGENYPGNLTAHAGTTMQEVLRALIDRASYVNNQIPCAETQAVIGLLQTAILLLEQRAARRHGRTLELTVLDFIQERATCMKCGHIGCEGSCH